MERHVEYEFWMDCHSFCEKEIPLAVWWPGREELVM